MVAKLYFHNLFYKIIYLLTVMWILYFILYLLSFPEVFSSNRNRHNHLNHKSLFETNRKKVTKKLYIFVATLILEVHICKKQSYTNNLLYSVFTSIFTRAVFFFHREIKILTVLNAETGFPEITITKNENSKGTLFRNIQDYGR